MIADHSHRWVIESFPSLPRGRYVGACKLCEAERTFDPWDSQKGMNEMGLQKASPQRRKR